ncbi:MAG: hypothetical protein HQK53_06670 [Oligoflexia bacterium]|nr:hypothetical protein [Oligoflexia bacterium]
MKSTLSTLSLICLIFLSACDAKKGGDDSGSGGIVSAPKGIAIDDAGDMGEKISIGNVIGSKSNSGGGASGPGPSSYPDKVGFLAEYSDAVAAGTGDKTDTIAALHAATKGTVPPANGGEALYTYLTTHTDLDLSGQTVKDLSILKHINNIESITLDNLGNGVLETSFSN